MTRSSSSFIFNGYRLLWTKPSEFNNTSTCRKYWFVSMSARTDSVRCSWRNFNCSSILRFVQELPKSTTCPFRPYSFLWSILSSLENCCFTWLQVNIYCLSTLQNTSCDNPLHLIAFLLQEKVTVSKRRKQNELPSFLVKARHEWSLRRIPLYRLPRPSSRAAVEGSPACPTCQNEIGTYGFCCQVTHCTNSWRKASIPEGYLGWCMSEEGRGVSTKIHYAAFRRNRTLEDFRNHVTQHQYLFENSCRKGDKKP